MRRFLIKFSINPGIKFNLNEEILFIDDNSLLFNLDSNAYLENADSIKDFQINKVLNSINLGLLS